MKDYFWATEMGGRREFTTMRNTAWRSLRASLEPLAYRIPEREADTEDLPAIVRKRMESDASDVTLRMTSHQTSQVDSRLYLIGSPEICVNAWYFLTRLRVMEPGFPVPMTRPSTFTTGISSAPVPVRKHSSALKTS